MLGIIRARIPRRREAASKDSPVAAAGPAPESSFEALAAQGRLKTRPCVDRNAKRVVSLLAAGALVGLAPRAGVANPSAFPQTTGEALYQNICQGCHMSDAKGAVGAGAYPTLAGDSKLQSPAYPIYIVIHGRNAMPGFGGLLDDAQIAAVVDYVRGHFGNSYLDQTSIEQVREAR